MTDHATPTGPIAQALFDGTIAPSAPSASFTHSVSISKIGAALAAAQAEITQPTKAADNTYFSSKYATLDVVWNAARQAFAKHGIAVIQSPSYEVVDLVVETKTKADGTVESMKTKKFGVVSLTTMVTHTSGEWMKGVHHALSEQIGPQGAQSALTYTRRASLSCFAMITPQNEDDDGNGASNNADKPSAASIDGWSKGLSKASKEGTDALKAAWEKLPDEAKPMLEVLKDALKAQAVRADEANAQMQAKAAA